MICFDSDDPRRLLHKSNIPEAVTNEWTAILLKKFSSGIFATGILVMATNILKLSVARAACRGLATQAAPAQADASGYGPEINCTMLSNKILVSSQDSSGALSRISVVFRTGPRNEVFKNAGATHVIRSVTGFSTHNFTDFFILRNLQQSGAYLTCTGDREMTSFNIVATRDKIFSVYGFLSSVVSQPAFKPWQIKRNYPRMKYEISALSRETRTMEMLHKAAFRTGLGNPLFLTNEQIESLTPEILCDFYSNSFTANRAVVAGYNVAHKDILRFAESFVLPSGDPPAGNSEFFGGEIREEKNSYFATIALATQGSGSKDLKQSLVYGVLQQSLGSITSVKWGGSPSPLYKQITAVSATASAGCFNICYSDNGLFGILIHTSAQNACAVIDTAWKVLKSGQVSNADIQRGKAILKMKILENASNSEALIDDFAAQSLINGAVVPAPVLAEAIDKISPAEVQAAAKKIAGGKYCMAAYGNLSEVPYLDELK